MPAIIASLIRVLIQAAVQTGMFIALEKIISPLTDKLKELVARHYGMTDEEAQDTVANEIIDALAMIGIIGIGIKSKLPTIVAEKLGFTSKGYIKRTLSKGTEAKIATGGKINLASPVAKTAEVEIIAEAVAKSRGLGLGGVKTLLAIVGSLIGIPTAFFFALAQYIDFANWQGPYQKTFQGLLSKIGINPDSPMPKASVVSADIWKRIYATIEQLEPRGISFPFSGSDKPYSRLALSDLVDEIAANIVKNGGNASYKNVIGAVLPLINLTDKVRTDADIEKILANVPAIAGAPTSSSSTIKTTKVFTGIVSQGVVGKGLEFTSRPDDLIESAEELRQAAANNLSPYLNTLLGKIVYEVKVVSSIITKEGFKQTGTTQQVQTGTDASGRPKYKTVTNKFATLIVYALTDKGSRAKLTTIVLGPVNSAKLIVGQNDLRSLETELPALVTTTDINEIKGLETANPITITTPGVPPAISDSMPATTPLVTSAPQPITAATSGVIVGNNASTLFEWYQAQGQNVPSVEARSLIYAGYGLGQASYYTGTAEQNTKLLQALKSGPIKTAPSPSPTPAPKPAPSPSPTPAPKSPTKTIIPNVETYKIKTGDKFSPFTGKALTWSVGKTIYGTYQPAKDYGEANPNK